MIRTNIKNLPQHLYQSFPLAETRAAATRTAINVAKDNGEKLAGSFSGDFVSFSKILAKENEKLRKMQGLRHGPKEGLKKVQPL